MSKYDLILIVGAVLGIIAFAIYAGSLDEQKPSTPTHGVGYGRE